MVLVALVVLVVLVTAVTANVCDPAHWLRVPSCRVRERQALQSGSLLMRSWENELQMNFICLMQVLRRRHYENCHPVQGHSEKMRHENRDLLPHPPPAPALPGPLCEGRLAGCESPPGFPTSINLAYPGSRRERNEH